MPNSVDTSHSLHLEGGESCVMMLHGLGANELEFQRLAKELNAAGFTVVVSHIDGYTHNTPPQSWEAWVEQAQAELWKLEKRYASVSVVGLSMGSVWPWWWRSGKQGPWLAWYCCQLRLLTMDGACLGIGGCSLFLLGFHSLKNTACKSLSLMV